MAAAGMLQVPEERDAVPEKGVVAEDALDRVRDLASALGPAHRCFDRIQVDSGSPIADLPGTFGEAHRSAREVPGQRAPVHVAFASSSS